VLLTSSNLTLSSLLHIRPSTWGMIRPKVLRPGMKGLAIVSGLALATTAAHGQVASYSVSHTFTFNPPPGFVGTPVLTGYYFQHAWIREIGPGGWIPTTDVVPAQGPLFDPVGFELLQGVGAINLPRSGGPGSPVAYAQFAIPPAGYFGTGCTTVIAQNCYAVAAACTQFDVQPFGPGTSIHGTYLSGGAVNTGNCRRVETYAFSSAGMNVSGISPTGQILWNVSLGQVSGGVFRRRIVADPIKITVRDASGNSASAIALAIDFDNDGPGGIDWQGGNLTISATDSRLIIDMDPAVTIGGGSLLLETHGGAVVQAVGSGQFANWALPPIGTNVPFTALVPADIVVNFDATGLLPGRVAQTRLELFGGGGMPDSNLCAADFNGDGEVDFFDYLDFVAAFSEGHPSADFNGDGEIDFFDYLDFVAAFSQGC